MLLQYIDHLLTSLSLSFLGCRVPLLLSPLARQRSLASSVPLLQAPPPPRSWPPTPPSWPSRTMCRSRLWRTPWNWTTRPSKTVSEGGGYGTMNLNFMAWRWISFFQPLVLSFFHKAFSYLLSSLAFPFPFPSPSQAGWSFRSLATDPIPRRTVPTTRSPSLPRT